MKVGLILRKGSRGRVKYLSKTTLFVVLLISLVINASANLDLDTEYRSILKSMSLEDKVGQMLLLGVPGTTLNSTSKAVITELNAGGVVLFAANLISTNQAIEFTTDLQKEAMKTKWKVPLLITADEEGGLVSRMPSGMITMPGNMALGATKNEYLSMMSYYHIGRQLRALGINMNLAPVLDVNNNPQNPVIGVRSFGSDPNLVANMAVAALSGLKDANVGSIVKHFPGHGDTGVDSHLALPIVRKDKESLEKMELLPFKKALQNNAMAVMTAHIEFPALTGGKNTPATLSKEIVTGLLRATWGYDGVVSTDDMLMKAITNYFGLKDAVVMAVNAGIDQILLAGDISKQREAKKAIIDAVKRGEISEERIDQSVSRIFKLKAQIGLKPNKVPELLDAKKEAEAASKIALESALSSITIIKNEERLLKKGDNILLLVADSNLMGASGRSGTKVSQLMQSELTKRGFSVKTIALSYRPTNYEINLASTSLKDSDIVVFLTRNASIEQAKLVETLKEKPLITVAIQNPYDILSYPSVKVHLLTYGYTEASIKALAMVLVGEAEALGTLPVFVSNDYYYGYKH